ncbi:DUF2490 domain-containing protein [Jiulongibacter sp. NS-SX5]|uniref:DUF2490 domain-containing protein n=1 Tax=Jiulongibacter sp. NS-SX5 TaxID=3463854 RepID=UPI0040598534
MLKKIITPLFFILFALQSKGQLGVWNKVTAEADLGKKVELEVNAQARTGDIMQSFERYLGEAGLKYELIKNLDLGVYYRYTLKTASEGNPDHFHRFYGELKYKQKLHKPLKLSYRLRYQQQFKDGLATDALDSSYLRNKLELSTKVGQRFQPYLGADIFYEIGNTFDQLRYSLGTEIKLSKKTSLDIGIQTDDPLNSNKSNDWRIDWGLKFKLN